METIKDLVDELRAGVKDPLGDCGLAERIETAHNREMHELAESKRTFIELSEARLRKALMEAYTENRHMRRLLHPKQDTTNPSIVDIAHDMSRQAKAYEKEVERYGNTSGHCVGFIRDAAEKIVSACQSCPVDTYLRKIDKLKKDNDELLSKEKCLAERIRALLLYFDNKGDMTVGYLNESDEISSEILGVKPLYDTTEDVK